MANPLNPIEWLKTAQDWFVKAERSSGFRPYLVFLMLASGVSLVLLTWSHDALVRLVALWIMGGSFAGFVVLYSVKAFQDPDFCRSETHLHRMKKLELEYMGSESEVLPGEIVEQQTAIEEPPQPPQIGGDMDAEVGGR